MPLKVIQIILEDPPAPFDAGSELFSYIAYPIEEERRLKFASMLYRWAHFWQMRKDPQWGITPHFMRPKRLEPPGGIDESVVYRGMELIRRRLTIAPSILLPFLRAYTTGKRLQNVGDLSATVNHICQRLIERDGGDAASKLSNFKTRDWSPTRPVAHLALALYLEVYSARIKEASNRNKAIWEVLSPYPPDLKLQEILELAEHVRVLLPLLAQVRFREEEIIMFVPSGSGTLQEVEG
jgi:hypothetical protein